MSSPWVLLGVAPTNDKRAIKRAYAKQLKSTHPDDDPEAFQRLNEAYQYALSGLDSEVSEAWESDAAEPVSGELERVGVAAPAFRPIDELCQEFRQLLNKADAEGFAEFIGCNELADFQYKESVSSHLFGILIDVTSDRIGTPVDSEYYSELSELFLWHEQELELCRRFDSRDVGRVLALLQSKAKPQSGKQIPDESQFTVTSDRETDPRVSGYLVALAILFVVLILVVT